MRARKAATSFRSSPRRSARPSCRRKPGRAPTPSSRSSARWRRCRPKRRSRAIISTCCSALPWGKKSKLKKDIAEAQRVLDEDHYGLEKVKDRIVEYLAVQARTNKLKGPILCLVGPPGVGKTSLGRSIARATGPRIRSPVTGRSARRGRNPRPPPDLHRLASGQDHLEHQEGGDVQPAVPAR